METLSNAYRFSIIKNNTSDYYYNSAVYLVPGSTSFPGAQNHHIITLMQWQYWWWFWFSMAVALYYSVSTRLINNRLTYQNPKIVTSYRSHGRWGDLIICLIPVFWCINILSSSHFLLKALEWQTEASPFTLRVRGKQWYWVYKFGLNNAMHIDEIPKFIGRGKKVYFKRHHTGRHDLSTKSTRFKYFNDSRQSAALEKSETLKNRSRDFYQNQTDSKKKKYLYTLQVGKTPQNRVSFFNNSTAYVTYFDDLIERKYGSTKHRTLSVTKTNMDFVLAKKLLGFLLQSQSQGWSMGFKSIEVFVTKHCIPKTYRKQAVPAINTFLRKTLMNPIAFYKLSHIDNLSFSYHKYLNGGPSSCKNEPHNLVVKTMNALVKVGHFRIIRKYVNLNVATFCIIKRVSAVRLALVRLKLPFTSAQSRLNNMGALLRNNKKFFNSFNINKVPLNYVVSGFAKEPIAIHLTHISTLGKVRDFLLLGDAKFLILEAYNNLHVGKGLLAKLNNNLRLIRSNELSKRASLTDVYFNTDVIEPAYLVRANAGVKLMDSVQKKVTWLVLLRSFAKVHPHLSTRLFWMRRDQRFGLPTLHIVKKLATESLSTPFGYTTSMESTWKRSFGNHPSSNNYGIAMSSFLAYKYASAGNKPTSARDVTLRFFKIRGMTHNYNSTMWNKVASRLSRRRVAWNVYQYTTKKIDSRVLDRNYEIAIKIVKRFRPALLHTRTINLSGASKYQKTYRNDFGSNLKNSTIYYINKRAVKNLSGIGECIFYKNSGTACCDMFKNNYNSGKIELHKNKRLAVSGARALVSLYKNTASVCFVKKKKSILSLSNRIIRSVRFLPKLAKFTTKSVNKFGKPQRERMFYKTRNLIMHLDTMGIRQDFFINHRKRRVMEYAASCRVFFIKSEYIKLATTGTFSYPMWHLGLLKKMSFGGVNTCLAFFKHARPFVCYNQRVSKSALNLLNGSSIFYKNYYISSYFSKKHERVLESFLQSTLISSKQYRLGKFWFHNCVWVRIRTPVLSLLKYTLTNSRFGAIETIMNSYRSSLGSSRNYIRRATTWSRITSLSTINKLAAFCKTTADVHKPVLSELLTILSAKDLPLFAENTIVFLQQDLAYSNLSWAVGPGFNRWIKDADTCNGPIHIVKGTMSSNSPISLEFSDNRRIVRDSEDNTNAIIKQKRVDSVSFSSKIDSRAVGHVTQFGYNNSYIDFGNVIVSNPNYVDEHQYEFKGKHRSYNSRDNIVNLDKSYPHQKRLLWVNKQIILPTQTAVTIITNSYDVIHSWFIPGLGLKLDCVPGRSTHHTIYIEHTGYYYGQCAEVCGRRHHHMPIKILAVPLSHFTYWWKNSMRYGQ